MASRSTWDWVTTLTKNPSKRGATVAAFPHAPLCNEWLNLYPDGVVGEYVYSRDPGNDCHSEPDRLGESRYWFVRTLNSAGYYVYIEFLGYGEVDREEVEEARCWVHYADLKPLCHYTDMDGYALDPPIDTKEDLTFNDLLARLYAEMIGKLGVPKLADAFVVQKNIIRYKIGDRIEYQDSKCANKMLKGFVTKIVGGRLSLKDGGTKAVHARVKMTDEFWCSANSYDVHPVGWSVTAGVPNPPSSPLDPPISVEDLDVEVWDRNLILLNSCFEMVNPFDYTQIVAAQVTEVLNHGFFMCSIISKIDPEDYKQKADGKNSFHRHITSPWIMPCGTSQEAGVDVVSREEMKRSIEWDVYLAANQFAALEIPERKEKDHHQHLKKGVWVEAVDHVKPSLICPAYIIKVIPGYLVKIRYLGWNFEFDQWKPIDCPEIYPIGWCSLLGYPLAAPGAHEVIFEHESPEATPVPDSPEEVLPDMEDSDTDDDDKFFQDSDSEAEFHSATSSEEVQVEPTRVSPVKVKITPVKRPATSTQKRPSSKLLKTDETVQGTSKKKAATNRSSSKRPLTPPRRPSRSSRKPVLHDDSESEAESSAADTEPEEASAPAKASDPPTGSRRKSQKPTKNAGDHILEMSKQPRRKSKIPAKPKNKIAVPTRKSALKKEASKNATATTSKQPIATVTMSDDDDDKSRSPAKGKATSESHDDSSAQNSDAGGSSGPRGRRSRKPPAFYGNNVATGQVRFN